MQAPTDSIFTRVRDYLYDRLSVLYRKRVLHRAYGRDIPVPIFNIGGIEDAPFQVFMEELPISDYSERPTTCPPIQTQWEQRIYVVAMGKDRAEAARYAAIYIDVIFQLCLHDKSLKRLVFNTIPSITWTDTYTAQDGSLYATATVTIRTRADIPRNEVIFKTLHNFDKEKDEVDDAEVPDDAGFYSVH